MVNQKPQPQFFHILNREAIQVTETTFGLVGTLYSDADIEAVWVSKAGEQIDPDWFSQDVVDLICVLQGKLKVEFEDPQNPDRVMTPGEIMILPPNTNCRAYRWPRDSTAATVFLAIYPNKK
jgi:hypothetical protein